MKRSVLLFALCLLFTSIGYAQQRNDLTGPKAKNYKPWKDKSKKTTTLYSVTNPIQLTGPEAKNEKSWDKKDQPKAYRRITTSNRPTVTGPRAKNRKPWSDDWRRNLSKWRRR